MTESIVKCIVVGTDKQVAYARDKAARMLANPNPFMPKVADFAAEIASAAETMPADAALRARHVAASMPAIMTHAKFWLDGPDMTCKALVAYVQEGRLYNEYSGADSSSAFAAIGFSKL